MISSISNLLKSPHFWRVWLPPHVFAALYLWLNTSSWILVLAAFLVFYSLISGLGVAVGLHRYFSHISFKTTKFWEQTMLVFGCLACHGNPLFWVALHRGLHHRFADTDMDPHSPAHQSLWESYQGYAFQPDLVDRVPVKAGAYILRHPEWRWSYETYHSVLWVVWLSVAYASFVTGSFWFAAGLSLAQVWAIHQEALVNVVGHVNGFGSKRPFDRADHSVDRPLLALFTWGQALHNSHHANQTEADFASCTKWAFDPSMIWISLIREPEEPK